MSSTSKKRKAENVLVFVVITVEIQCGDVESYLSNVVLSNAELFDSMSKET